MRKVDDAQHLQLVSLLLVLLVLFILGIAVICVTWPPRVDVPKEKLGAWIAVLERERRLFLQYD